MGPDSITKSSSLDRLSGGRLSVRSTCEGCLRVIATQRSTTLRFRSFDHSREVARWKVSYLATA